MADTKPVAVEEVTSVPQNNAPSNNRMIIAFPFSAVKISRNDEMVAALGALVAELAEFVGKGTPGPEADRLADRARALAARIGQGSDA
jgi:hypothetical protein